ncbi:MAG: DUF2156 domain-containing protein [Nitrospinota bacterium]|nr:DUF2156 domain-containing protein [Nitrospinota bacterium]
MAMHTIQPGMEAFKDLGGAPGFIGFKDQGRFRHAVGDPVCPPDAADRMLRRFHQSHDRITFFHVSPSTARVLRDLGYFVNQIGEEAVIDLAGHTWNGRDKEDIRRQHNNALKAGVAVLEIYGDMALSHEADRLSSQWLAKVKRGKKELCYAARRPCFPGGPGVREFYGFRGGRMEAFVHFDPIFHEGEVEGYIPAVSRRRPDSPKGTQALIVREAMAQFRKEGVARLYLGLLPAHKVEDKDDLELNPSPFVSRLFGWMGSSPLANRFYPFRSVSFHKTRYRAQARKVYMAFGRRYPVTDLISFGRMTGIL